MGCYACPSKVFHMKVDRGVDILSMRLFASFREPGGGGAADIFLLSFTGETCWRAHLPSAQGYV